MHRPPAPSREFPAAADLPRHIGIIMDGNGRWARARHLPRAAGHRAGVRAIRPTIEACHDSGVHIVTLYAFSTENWSRPKAEVVALMRLFGETITSEIEELHQKGIQIRALGELDRLGKTLRQRVLDAEVLTANNQSAILNVAINYGGRDEIMSAIHELAGAGADMRQITPSDLDGALYTSGLPDPDLIIRTAGEQRLSNFLIWQAAYAELHVTDVLWPDFGAGDVAAALDDYRSRIRRFGAVVESPPQERSTRPRA